MLLKKLFLSNLIVLVIFGVFVNGFKQNPQIVVTANYSVTKRIWAIARPSWWFGDEIIFSVATATSFVGNSAQNYTTYTMTRDINNFDTGTSDEFVGSQTHAYFVDVPTNVSHVEFFRQDKNLNSNNRYNYSGWTSYSSGMKYIYEDNGIKVATFDGFAFQTTKIVSDFIVKTNNLEGLCTSTKVIELSNDYNTLKTFEKNQYDSTNVGTGVTGLQRLNYLRGLTGVSSPALN